MQECGKEMHRLRVRGEIIPDELRARYNTLLQQYQATLA
jgi:hypothetical protein